MRVIQLLLALPLDPAPAWAEVLLAENASFPEDETSTEGNNRAPGERPEHQQSTRRRVDHPCVPAYDARRRTSLCLNCGETMDRCTGARVGL